jgi:AcrR family transcriptional regulator
MQYICYTAVHYIIGGVKLPMSPRPYRLGQRQAASDQTRSRILDATRDLLMTPDGYSRFSIEAVARQADVARMTVYHQFGSRLGLLEALCDSLAAGGGMEQIATAFRQPEPLEVLRQYVFVFGRFWDVDRLVMRRLRALAALDPDFEQVIRTRDQWRRQGLRMIMQRFVERGMLCPAEPFEETVDALFTLLSFETFDALAGPTRSLEEIVPQVYRLARAAITLNTA